MNNRRYMGAYSASEDHVILTAVATSPSRSAAFKQAARQLRGRAEKSISNHYYSKLAKQPRVGAKPTEVVTSPLRVLGITKFVGKISVGDTTLEGEFLTN